MRSQMIDKGVLYVATGDNYVQEASESAKSVREVMPDIHITLRTDRSDGPDVFDTVENYIDNPVYDFRDRIQGLLNSPYERTLYLDTDTYVNRELSDVFLVLDRVAVAAAHAGSREEFYKIGNHFDSPIVDVPSTWPLFQCGVIAYSTDGEDLMQDWLDLYRTHRREGLTTNDQPAFRTVSYESDVSIATLPPEYNVQVPFRGIVQAPVRIVHGRGVDSADVAHRLERVDKAALYDNATIGSSAEVLVDPGKWVRRLIAIKLSIQQFGILSTLIWLIRWILADDKHGLKPVSLQKHMSRYLG